MTPEHQKELRWKYADNLIEMMALQPELFLDEEANPIILPPPNLPDGKSSAVTPDVR